MLRSIVIWATIAVAAFASPTPQWGDSPKWSDNGVCTPDKVKIRRNFDKLAPYERKAFTDAINCIREQPSHLDQELYSGAVNRFFDYAAVHINRTNVAHLSGFFLTWHRMFVHLFEQDLKDRCGYEGTMPYWNWPETAGHLGSAPIIDGSEYSMSGNGEYIDQGPYLLGANFSLPHGQGGGCVKTGPFAGMTYTFAVIPSNRLQQGLPLPPTAFEKNETCLTRDLNNAVSLRYLNQSAFDGAVAAPDQSTFSTLLNGIFGGGELGLHSGAHFAVGPPASSIYVSPQDPIWYPMHAFLDVIYTQWQKKHPEIYDQVYGTMTANNVPPSANVTLDSVLPDFGYFYEDPVTIRDLISTTAGPFCYEYEFP
jgi:tyrosinase